MCIAAGTIFAVSTVAFISIGIPYVPPAPGVHAELGELQTPAAGAGAETPKVSPVPATQLTLLLTQREVVTSWAFVLLWSQLFFALTPDFGVKYMISPLLETTFGASDEEQSTASFLFLMTYSLSRLVSGGCSKYIRPKVMYLCALGVQLVGFCGSGLILHYQDVDDNEVAGGLDWFVASQSIIGLCMGATKVLFFLLAFECFQATNFPIAVGSLATAFGVAAFIGPFCSWQTVEGYIPPDTKGSFDPTHTAAYMWAGAGSTLLSMILAALLKPIDFEEVARNRKTSPPSEEDIRLSDELRLSSTQSSMW